MTKKKRKTSQIMLQGGYHEHVYYTYTSIDQSINQNKTEQKTEKVTRREKKKTPCHAIYIYIYIYPFYPLKHIEGGEKLRKENISYPIFNFAKTRNTERNIRMLKIISRPRLTRKGGQG